MVFKEKTLGTIAFHAAGKLAAILTVFASLKIISTQLGIAAYGLWMQVIFAIKLFVPLVVMQLETALIRFFNDPRYQAKQMWFPLFVCILSFNGLLSCFLLLSPTTSSQLIFGHQEHIAYLPYILLLIATESTFLYLTSYFRAQQQTKKLTIWRVVQNILQLFALFFQLTFLNQSLIQLATGFIGINVILILVLLFLIGKQNHILSSMQAFNLKQIRSLLRYSFPLTLAGFSTWLIYASDRFFLAYFFNLETVGLYAAMSIFGGSALMLLDAFNLIVFPQCVALWTSPEPTSALRHAKSMSNLYLGLISIGAALVFAIGPSLLVLLSTPDFSFDAIWLVLLVLSYALPGFDQRYIILIHLQQRTSILARINIIAAAFNLALNLLLIPAWEIQGAIVSTLCTYFFRSLWIWWWGRKARFKVIKNPH